MRILICHGGCINFNELLSVIYLGQFVHAGISIKAQCMHMQAPLFIVLSHTKFIVRTITQLHAMIYRVKCTPSANNTCQHCHSVHVHASENTGSSITTEAWYSCLDGYW
jgi:hypothetical protein